MIVLRCTKRLQRHLDLPAAEAATRPSTSLLGDWYANFLTARPQHLAICVNERSLLTVVVPIAPRMTFLQRFQSAARVRISQVPAPKEARDTAIADLEQVGVGPTLNRSVVGSLNNLGQLGLHFLAAGPPTDPEALAHRLCETPMLTLEWTFPWEEAARLLGGGRPAGRRKCRDAT